MLKKLFEKKNLLVIVLLAGISLTFFWQFFFKGLVPIPSDLLVGIYFPWRDHLWNGFLAGVPFKNGLLSDVISIIYPWRIYGINLLKQGIWPLWIPHALAGTPLLANFQSGLFYPLNVLFFAFSEVNAWSLYIVFQPFLASIFGFFYLRNLKLNLLASLFGALIFAFSGFSLVWLEYGIVGHSGLWLPLVLLAIDKILERFSFFWLGVGSLAIGFSVLAGYPQLSFFILLISFFYTLFKTQKIKPFFSVFSFLLLGILVSSIQLLPGLELTTLSIRGNDPTTQSFDFGLNPIKNLILLLAPDFYGNPSTGNFWGWGGYNESVSYVGVAGLVLALVGFLVGRRSKTLTFFKIGFLLSLGLVFKNPLSLFLFKAKLPILESASAGRFLFLSSFFLAVLASFGVQALFLQKNKVRIFRGLTFFFFLFLSFLLLVFFKPQIWPDRNLMDNLIVVRRNLILPAVLTISCLTLIVFSLLRKEKWLKSISLCFLFLVTVFDLFRFGWKYNPFTHREFLYPQTNLTDFIKAQKDLGRFVGLIPQSMFIPYDFSSPEGYEPLMIKSFAEFANQINEERFSQISTGSRWVIVNRYESPLLDLLGTKYLLSFKGDAKSQWEPEYFKYSHSQFELLFQYNRSQVYERKNALPRAFLVNDFKVLSQEEILKTLMDREFNPQKTLLLEKRPEILPVKGEGGGQVSINKDSYFKNEVLIDVSTSGDSFLFLSDVFYPGWQAYVDNHKTEIYKANYAFRSVFVPAGKHQVKFLFQPKSFKIGLVISTVSLFVILSLFTSEIIKSRNSSPKRSA